MKRSVWVLAAVYWLVSGTAGATVFLQDGAGFWWDFDGTGSVIDGSAAVTETTDAFDGAAKLLVDGNPFPEDAPQTTAMNGRMVVTGPATLSGLTVTRRAYVPDGTGEGWACFLEYFANETTADINVAIRLSGNLGSDGGTCVTASSSGDTVFTTADRWIASDDGNDGGSDPSLAFNWRGADSSITPSSVELPASQQDYHVDYSAIAVPAGMQVVIMYFIAQNANNAAAQATAQTLDTLPETAQAAIRANYAPVLNWSIPDAMEVSPADVFFAAGQQGGPFTPPSHTYLVRNTGSATLNWSIDKPDWISLSFGFTSGGGVSVTATINEAAGVLLPGEEYGTLVFHNLTSGVDIVRNIDLSVGERLAIVPESETVLTGFQGGPFTPSSLPFTLTNTGTPESIQWTGYVPLFAAIAPESGTIAPGASSDAILTLNAAASVLEPGSYSGTVTFHNDTFATAQTRHVTLQINERLAVTPTAPVTARGLHGGPFVPSSWKYTITNQGATAIDWLVEAPAWLTVSPSSGSALAGGGTVEITAGVNASANSLAADDYTGVITFHNPTYATTLTRDVFLRSKEVVFVDGSVTSPGDGSSWTAALKTIQEGINAAAPTKSWVWVADGSYVEQILVAAGVEVYGGFAGGETLFAERDPAAHVTIIDGDAADTAVTLYNVTGAGIDGFTVQNGYAQGTAPDNCGGGIRCTGVAASCFIGHCVIRNNAATFRGAGIYCLDDSAPLIEDCTLAGNDTDADFGGGIGCTESNPTIRNCRVCNNHGRFGAGIGCIESSPTIDNCIISGNWAASANGGAGGGGIFAHNHSSPAVHNCVITGNLTVDWDGAALYCQGTSKPVLTNCTLGSNRSIHSDPLASIRSGVTGNTGSAPVLANCILTDLKELAVYEEDAWPRTAENETDITVRHCLFFDNGTADFRDWADGVQTLYTGGDIIDAHVDGAMSNVPGNPDPLFMPSVTGTWTAPPVYDPATHLTTLTSTGAGFTAGALAGRLINPDTTQARQAFVVGNTVDTILVPGDITQASGRFGYVDNGDAFAILEYHLAGDSPCIDAGEATGLTETDLDGASRVQHGAVDIGAYECAAPEAARIVSIERIGNEIAGNGTVGFLVTFSRPIASGLSVADFIVNATGGQLDAQIVSVTGQDYRWVVTVATGTGNGTLSIVVADTAPAITDAIGLVVEAASVEIPVYQVDVMRFTEDPQGAMKRPGQPHTFHVTVADAIGEIHYQWNKDNAPVSGAADSPTLAFEHTAETDTGVYTCTATDSMISVTSNTAGLQVAVPMSIEEQPRGAAKTAGGTYTFTVTVAGGFRPLTYIWQKNGTPVEGGTEPSLTLAPLQTEHTGAYSVVVMDANTDVVQSDSAELQVYAGLPVAGWVGITILGAVMLGLGLCRKRKAC